MPTAIDYFCGSRVPVGRALAWCGWAVVAKDRSLEEATDLTDEKEASEVRSRHLEYDAAMIAAPCGSMSRVREVNLQKRGCNVRSPPLRNAQYPRGLPGLSAADQQKVDEGNLCADLAWELAGQSLQAESAGELHAMVMESPDRSWHWAQAGAVKAREYESWAETPYAACALMGARSKKEKLGSNVEEIKLIK